MSEFGSLLRMVCLSSLTKPEVYVAHILSKLLGLAKSTQINSSATTSLSLSLWQCEWSVGGEWRCSKLRKRPQGWLQRRFLVNSKHYLILTIWTPSSNCNTLFTSLSLSLSVRQNVVYVKCIDQSWIRWCNKYRKEW